MIKLYRNGASPNSKRVMICAAELGLELDIHDLDFGKGANREDAYLKLNPMGKVPTLDEDGWPLWESAAIAWYLAESNPSKGLLPADIKGRSDQMRWMFWNACHLESAVTGLLHERTIKPLLGQTGDEKLIEEHLKGVHRFLPVLNAHLEGRPWMGKQFSLADVCLGVTVELCPALQVDLAPYPHAAAWLGRLQRRPSWVASSAVEASEA